MLRPRTVLVLTRHTPLPNEDGPGAYLFDILRHLRSQGFTVHVAWLAPHEHLRRQGLWSLPAEFARAFHLHVPGAVHIGRHQFFPGNCRLRLRAWLRRFITRGTAAPQPVQHVPGGISTRHDSDRMDAPSDAERAFAAGLLASLRPSAVIANYAWLTPLFAAAPAGLSFRRICLHPEVAWKRAAIQSSITGCPPAITAGAEAALLGAAGTIVCPSDADIREHRLRLPDGDFVLAPKAVRPQPLPPATAPRLLFVGSSSSPNAAGLAWFLAEVWPQIRAGRPAAELDVCGSVAEVVPARPAGVGFHGHVDDLEAFYRTAAIVIVPLLHATGLSIGLVDAAARGRAIVTTPAPLDGAPFLAGTVASAEKPAVFASLVLSLLADPVARLELAERSLAALRGRLDPETCYATLTAALCS